ncbi:MAG: hypothetical protein AB1761_17515 [Pseudomonadota bacterium]
MRRILLIVLALVLPLKAVAAGVVPIVGAPEHVHTAAHAPGPMHAGHVYAAAAQVHDGVDAHSHDASTPANTLHEHACPHLGMASIVPPLAAFEAGHCAPRAPSAFVAHFVSIVLDVPSPPPTRRA